MQSKFFFLWIESRIWCGKLDVSWKCNDFLYFFDVDLLVSLSSGGWSRRAAISKPNTSKMEINPGASSSHLPTSNFCCLCLVLTETVPVSCRSISRGILLTDRSILHDGQKHVSSLVSVDAVLRFEFMLLVRHRNRQKCQWISLRTYRKTPRISRTVLHQFLTSKVEVRLIRGELPLKHLSLSDSIQKTNWAFFLKKVTILKYFHMTISNFLWKKQILTCFPSQTIGKGNIYSK